MPKGGNKIHSLLAAVRSGRAGKQAVCVWESGIKQGNQIVFKHGLHFGVLLVLPVRGFQHEPYFILRDVFGQRQPMIETVVGV